MHLEQNVRQLIPEIEEKFGLMIIQFKLIAIHKLLCTSVADMVGTSKNWIPIDWQCTKIQRECLVWQI